MYKGNNAIKCMFVIDAFIQNALVSALLASLSLEAYNLVNV